MDITLFGAFILLSSRAVKEILDAAAKAKVVSIAVGAKIFNPKSGGGYSGEDPKDSDKDKKDNKDEGKNTAEGSQYEGYLSDGKITSN